MTANVDNCTLQEAFSGVKPQIAAFASISRSIQPGCMLLFQAFEECLQRPCRSTLLVGTNVTNGSIFRSEFLVLKVKYRRISLGSPVAM